MKSLLHPFSEGKLLFLLEEIKTSNVFSPLTRSKKCFVLHDIWRFPHLLLAVVAAVVPGEVHVLLLGGLHAVGEVDDAVSAVDQVDLDGGPLCLGGGRGERAHRVSSQVGEEGVGGTLGVSGDGGLAVRVRVNGGVVKALRDVVVVVVVQVVVSRVRWEEEAPKASSSSVPVSSSATVVEVVAVEAVTSVSAVYGGADHGAGGGVRPQVHVVVVVDDPSCRTAVVILRRRRGRCRGGRCGVDDHVGVAVVPRVDGGEVDVRIEGVGSGLRGAVGALSRCRSRCRCRDRCRHWASVGVGGRLGSCRRHRAPVGIGGRGGVADEGVVVGDDAPAGVGNDGVGLRAAIGASCRCRRSAAIRDEGIAVPSIGDKTAASASCADGISLRRSVGVGGGGGASSSSDERGRVNDGLADGGGLEASGGRA